MPSLAELLDDPRLRALTVVAGDPYEALIGEVVFVEGPHELAADGAERLVVAGRDYSEAIARDHLLDVTLREIAAQRVTALVLTGDLRHWHLSTPTLQQLRRLGPAIVTTSGALSTTDLLTSLCSALAGDAGQALNRLDKFATVLSAHPTGTPTSVPELLALASETLRRPVQFEATGSATSGPTVHMDGRLVGAVTTAPGSGNDATVARSVTWLVAQAIERSLHEQRRLEEGSTRSSEAVLSELLVATDEHAVRLSEQARVLGLPVDGWHRAFLLQPVRTVEPLGVDFLLGLSQVAVQSVGTISRLHLARSEGSVVLLESWSKDPRPTDSGAAQAKTMLATLATHFPSLELRCGIGTAHHGLTGLRATVVECRVALNRSRATRIAQYDSAGLQPMIVELANAGAARLAIRALIGPLVRLGGRRAGDAIHTLQIYLDERGSLTRSAEVLNVHRNSVAYRIRQIRELLDVDLDDPDQRLALQLACRAHLLNTAQR